jgi:hypothetical protein
MEWVASTLRTTSKHGVSSITTADAHTSAASSRLNWRPRRFEWTRPFRRKTKSDLCAYAITFHISTTFMCRLSWNLRTPTSWNPQFLSMSVQGLFFLHIYCLSVLKWPMLNKENIYFNFEQNTALTNTLLGSSAYTWPQYYKALMSTVLSVLNQLFLLVTLYQSV